MQWDALGSGGARIDGAP